MNIYAAVGCYRDIGWIQETYKPDVTILDQVSEYHTKDAILNYTWTGTRVVQEYRKCAVKQVCITKREGEAITIHHGHQEGVSCTGGEIK